jgi:hypothetical protein
MKSLWLAVVCLLPVILFAETVTKSSIPFSFPTGVAVHDNRYAAGSETVFTGTAHFTGKRVISFSWSAPQQAKKGSIALFSLSGVLVRSVAITAQSGSVEVNCTENQLPRGVYFAKLSFGTFEKTINFIMYR